MSRLTTRHGLAAAMAGAALLCLGATAGHAAIPATLAVQGALGPDHRDTGGGNDPVVNLRATIRNGALDNLYQEDHCGVVTVGRDGEFGILLGETLPVVLPFDEQYDVLIDACYDKHGCDGITNVDECDPDDRVQVVVMLDPVAYAHRAREADAISGSFLFNGDVAGPYFNLQLQPAVVGTPEIADGSVTIPKLGFDPATQLELDAEAAARAAADTAEANARAAADTAEANARAAADTAEANARAAADTAEANARAAADATEAAARVAGDNHAGDVAGPNTNLQIQAGAVGSPEIADASILLQDLAPNGAANRDYIRWNGTAWVRTPLGHIGNRGTVGGASALANAPEGAPWPTACCNTAFGFESQAAMTTGFQNTSMGDASLTSSTDGRRNIAIGAAALEFSTTGDDNVSVGAFSLRNTTGSGNIAIGSGAGDGLTTGSSNIYLGSGAGSASESNTIRIGGGQTAAFMAGVRSSTISGLSVVVDANGRLGTSGASPASDNHSGDVAGPSANLQIQPGTVGSAEVADNSLTASDLAAGSVGASEVIASQVQVRVNGSCPPGQAIRAIDSAGNVTCEIDTDTDTDTWRPLPSWSSSGDTEVDPFELQSYWWTCSNGCVSGGAYMTTDTDQDFWIVENGNSSSGGWYTTVYNSGVDDEYYRFSVWRLQ